MKLELLPDDIKIQLVEGPPIGIHRLVPAVRLGDRSWSGGVSSGPGGTLFVSFEPGYADQVCSYTGNLDNARHIKACLDFCRGIPTEVLIRRSA